MIIGICEGNISNIAEDYSHYCSNLNIYDSCSYDSLIIKLHFNTEYLSHEFCSGHKDSILGRIKKINIYTINRYNDNFTENSLLNSIFDIFFKKATYMMTQDPIALDYYLNNEPICTKDIELFLNTPPDSTSLQQFIIEYEEDNGTKYQDTTIPIYIKP
ncbi:hypothetical protein KBH77_05110 [Patescibacteria group bacterium]|nr:hypothetical protein [Patescibacteria group bacterium]